MTLNLCKTLNPADYDQLGRWLHLFNETQAAIHSTVHHEHRRWEYAIALEALSRDETIETVLEVGAGKSAMPTLLARRGYQVTVVDPDPAMVEAQRHFLTVYNVDAELIQADINSIKDGQYDAVVCLSTIEHIDNPQAVIDKLATFARKMIVLTTDYHQSGQAQFEHHKRTYNATTLDALCPEGWTTLETPTYNDDEAYIRFGEVAYNFASVVLVPAKEIRKTQKTTAKKNIVPERGG